MGNCLRPRRSSSQVDVLAGGRGSVVHVAAAASHPQTPRRPVAPVDDVDVDVVAAVVRHADGQFGGLGRGMGWGVFQPAYT